MLLLSLLYKSSNITYQILNVIKKPNKKTHKVDAIQKPKTNTINTQNKNTIVIVEIWMMQKKNLNPNMYTFLNKQNQKINLMKWNMYLVGRYRLPSIFSTCKIKEDDISIRSLT